MWCSLGAHLESSPATEWPHCPHRPPPCRSMWSPGHRGASDPSPGSTALSTPVNRSCKAPGQAAPVEGLQERALHVVHVQPPSTTTGSISDILGHAALGPGLLTAQQQENFWMLLYLFGFFRSWEPLCPPKVKWLFFPQAYLRWIPLTQRKIIINTNTVCLLDYLVFSVPLT